MKFFFTLSIVLLFTSCATNQNAYYYKQNVDVSQVANPEVIVGDPYMATVDDFTNAYNKALSEGYILLGLSVFQGALDNDYNSLQLARDKGASLVIRSARFSHTEYNNIYIPLTTTSTSSTTGYGTARSNVYNSNYSYVGSVDTSVRGTANTTTQNTNWVPVQTKEQIYFQATGLFIKSNIQYTLGAYYRDLNSDEQKELMSNKGVLITQVIKRSPAYDLDLVPGDVILEINGKKISDVFDVKQFLITKEVISEIKVNRLKQIVSLKKEDEARAISSINDTKTELKNLGPKKKH
jgi:hypothetical protein